MDRLNALSIFKTIVDKGGFSRAAEALDLTAGQVSRSLQELEGLLGAQLLQRTTRSISLTGIGQDVLSRAGILLDSYEDLAALGRTNASEPVGMVRMVAPTWYGHQVLGPSLARFKARFPKVSINLRLSDDPPDLVADGVDLALCQEEWLRPAFVARRLAKVEIALYASPDYLAQKGVPQHPADLLGHDCVTSTGLKSGANWCFDKPDGERYTLSVTASMGANDAGMLKNLALHGAGVVMLPTFMADDAVAEGRLERLLPDWQSVPVSLHVVYGSRRNQATAVRKLIEHLVEEAGSEPPAPCR